MIEPASEFLQLLRAVASAAAEDDRLYTIGVVPTRPETGYGYIMVGDQLRGEPELFEVADFVEKPDPDTAHEYLLRGGHLWNSGIFVWRAAVLLDAIRRHTPEIAHLLPLLDEGDVEGFFERAPVLSIDEGVLERSDAVAVARATFQWDDIGTWDAVARTRTADADGNITVGEVHAIDSHGCIAWAEEGSVVVVGTQDMVVVRDGGVTFVAPRERMHEMKAMLEQLPERIRRLED